MRDVERGRSALGREPRVHGGSLRQHEGQLEVDVVRRRAEGVLRRSVIKGLSASMQFFSQPDDCNVASYATPDAAMRALPDPLAFSTRLDMTGPNGGTPTLPALQGAIQYAQQVKAGITNGEKVVIVLVTDGDPNGCNWITDNVVARRCRDGGYRRSQRTYIGVGPDAVEPEQPSPRGRRHRTRQS